MLLSLLLSLKLSLLPLNGLIISGSEALTM